MSPVSTPPNRETIMQRLLATKDFMTFRIDWAYLTGLLGIDISSDRSKRMEADAETLQGVLSERDALTLSIHKWQIIADELPTDEQIYNGAPVSTVTTEIGCLTAETCPSCVLHAGHCKDCIIGQHVLHEKDMCITDLCDEEDPLFELCAETPYCPFPSRSQALQEVEYLKRVRDWMDNGAQE